VIPLLLRIANVPADPRLTGTGPCAAARLATVKHATVAPRTNALILFVPFADPHFDSTMMTVSFGLTPAKQLA
jgi:hypothetical protein